MESDSSRETSSQNLIEVSELSKSYGPVHALDRVSFNVREGQILGFLGPNGAGKSTTLRILAGFLPGDSGVVRVGGFDVHRQSLEVRRVIGYLPEGVPLYPDMRVTEYLRYRGRLKGVPRSRLRAQIDDVLDAAGVTDVRGRIIGTLSRGYRQRVGLADALLGEPKVLILDEPTVGLDPEQVRQFRALLREVGRDRTVILSTHILREVELCCSDVVIISSGRIVAQDRADRIRNMVGDQTCVVAEVACSEEQGLEAFESIPGVTRVRSEPANDSASGGSGVTGSADLASTALPAPSGAFRRFRVYSANVEDIRELVFDCVKRRDWRLRHLEREVLSLEEVFLDVVGRKTSRTVAVTEKAR